MPGQQLGPNYRHPFGKNEFLRSTDGVGRVESFMASAAVAPQLTIDGYTQKLLQPGFAIAKITSGPEAGKVGPFQLGVTDGRQTLANLVGLNGTFLPWQLNVRDVEIGVLYDCVAIQASCYELDAGGNWVALRDATADAMRNVKNMDIIFGLATNLDDTRGTEELVTGW